MSTNAKTTAYYNATASRYDEMHGEENNFEHTRALELLVPTYFSDAKYVLDVGTGTGRTLEWLDNYYRNNGTVAELTGVEPSDGLAEIARKNFQTRKSKLEAGRFSHSPMIDSTLLLSLACCITSKTPKRS